MLVVVLAIDLVDVDAHAHERACRGVEHHELVVALGRCHVPFIAQPEIDRQRRADGDGVLREERQGILGDVIAPLSERDAEGVGGAREERGHAREVELAGALREVVVEEPAEFAAGLERVSAGYAGQRVVEHVQSVLPTQRQIGWAAKIEGAGDDHLRQPDRTIDAVDDPDIQRVERVRLEPGEILRGPPKAGLVQQPRAEHVRLVHGQRGPGHRAPQAEAGNVDAKLRWLDALQPLASKEHQQAIARPGIVPGVRGPRVLVDPGVRGADEPRRAVGIGIVGARDQRDQPPHHRIRRGRTLVVAEHHGVHVGALALAQAFVRGKEERAAADDRTAERSRRTGGARTDADRAS